MSNETDIEKLAREIVATVLEPVVLRGQCGVRHEDELTFCVYEVPCPMHGNHSITARMALAYLAEKQRADDLAKRERTLFDAIAHGDDEHKAWLKEAIDAHFAGSPIPATRGQPAHAERERELRELIIQGQRAIRALGAGDIRCYDRMEAFVKKADALLAKEPNV